MKSNAQLRHEAQGAVPQPPPDLPTAAASSSSQVVPPSFDIEAAFAQLMTSMSALQREVNLIEERIEQNQIDIKQWLKYHHPKLNDDDDWVFIFLLFLSNFLNNFKFMLTLCVLLKHLWF
jgi:hypothetical protein